MGSEKLFGGNVSTTFPLQPSSDNEPHTRKMGTINFNSELLCLVIALLSQPMLMLKFDARSFFYRQLSLMFLDKTNSSLITAITALFLEAYFFQIGF